MMAGTRLETRIPQPPRQHLGSTIWLGAGSTLQPHSEAALSRLIALSFSPGVEWGEEMTSSIWDFILVQGIAPGSVPSYAFCAVLLKAEAFRSLTL